MSVVVHVAPSKAFRVKAKRNALTAVRGKFIEDLNACLPFHNYELMGDAVLAKDHGTDSDTSDSDADTDSDAGSDSDSDTRGWLLHSKEQDTHVEVRPLHTRGRARSSSGAAAGPFPSSSSSPASTRVQVDFVPALTPVERYMRVGLVIHKQHVRYVCVYVDADEARRSWDRYGLVPCSTDLLAIFAVFRMKIEAGVCAPSAPVAGTAGFKRWLADASRRMDSRRFSGPLMSSWVRVPGTGAVLDTKRHTFFDEADMCTPPESIVSRCGVVIGEPGSGRAQSAVFACERMAALAPAGTTCRPAHMHVKGILLVVPVCGVSWRVRELREARPRAVVTVLTSKTDFNAVTWGDVARSDYVVVSAKFLLSHVYLMHVHAVLTNICGDPEAASRHLRALQAQTQRPCGASSSATPGPSPRKRRRVVTDEDDGDGEGEGEVEAEADVHVQPQTQRMTRRQAQRLGVQVQAADTAAFDAATFFDTDKAAVSGRQGACPFVARQIVYLAGAARRILAAAPANSGRQWHALRRPVLELFVFRGMVCLDVDAYPASLPSRVKQLTAGVTWATGTEYASTSSSSLVHRWSVVLPTQVDVIRNTFAKFQYIVNGLCCRLATPKPGCNVYVDRVRMTNREYIADLALQYDLNDATRGPSRYESLFSTAAQSHESVCVVRKVDVVDELMKLSRAKTEALRQQARDVPTELGNAVAEVMNADADADASLPAVEFIFVDDSHIYAADGVDDDDEYVFGDDDDAEDDDDAAAADTDDDDNDNEDVEVEDEDDDLHDGTRLLRSLNAAANTFAQLAANIEQHERAATTLQERATTCVSQCLGVDVCSICLDGPVYAMIGCGHAFCLECIMQWYSDDNKKCPTCCVVADRVAIVAIDEEETAPPPVPEAFSVPAHAALWSAVTTAHTATTATFWLLARIADVEAAGKRVVIMTTRPGDGRIVMKAMAEHRGGGVVPVKSLCDCYGVRDAVTREFECGGCHVVVSYRDVVCGAYFRNVTHVLCILDGEGDEDDGEERDTLRAITALQSFTNVPAITVYALKHLRPARVAASL